MNLSLGEKIKNLREDKNLTQAALGKALNMTQRKISYIERNQYEPGIQDIVEICRFFSVSADYLLGLTNKRN
ncbi:MAG: helix-turn-helix transcriptional regulator [Clostridia bacterium]|nr:helix-turn-helix transcriptional regulator [Clostridia bacterium]